MALVAAEIIDDFPSYFTQVRALCSKREDLRFSCKKVENTNNFAVFFEWICQIRPACFCMSFHF